MSNPELIVPKRPAFDSVQAILARYVNIVDNPQAFLDSAQKPLPTCLWHNPLKTTSAALQQSLGLSNIALEQIRWMPDAFRVQEWSTPGRTIPYTAGWYYVQEEIAMAAVVVLDPHPGDSVLDLCAAPGGKMAQMALRVGESGTVIANEMHRDRLPSLTTNISRLGLTSVMTTQADGRSLLLASHSFDRVLVDAPCSGEGNLRRRQHPRPWQASHGLRIAAAQKKLLSRALDLVKPGGTVVYSTCTFAPEENEAVLDAVMGDRAYLEAFDIEGLQGQAGLLHWQGQSYRHDMVRARRYFPHFNDTGGFFVAKLRRTEVSLASHVHPGDIQLLHASILPAAIPADNLFKKLSEQFGISLEVFANYDCWATGRRRLWLLHKNASLIRGICPQTFGIPLATQTNLGLKPSTAFLQRFGRFVQRNVVCLPDRDAAEQFFQGNTQVIEDVVDEGYVHVRFQEFDLGCGRYLKGYLQSQLPKTLRWVATSTETEEGPSR